MGKLSTSRRVLVGVVLALEAVTRTAAATTCPPELGALFTYPSAQQSISGSGAVFWVVPRGSTAVERLSVDGVAIPAKGDSGLERLQFSPPALTAGPHALTLSLRLLDDSEQQMLTLPFEVSAEARGAGPGPAQVLPETFRHYQPDSAGQRQVLFERQLELLDHEDDCSKFVARQQLWAGCEDSGFGTGQDRLEFSAQGDVIGFLTQGSFLPAECRGSFFPQVEDPLTIYPVTASGVGAAAQFGGDPVIERAEESPLPPAYPYQPPSYESGSCALSSGARSSPLATGLVLVGAAFLAARRRGRGHRSV